MTVFGNTEFDGPYEATIQYDSSVRDNCHAEIRNKQPFRPFAAGEEVRVKVAANGDSVRFTDTVKEKHEGHKYASIGVDDRERLSLDPHDTIRFWVCGEASTEKVAIKPGSSVYHKVRNGEIVCGTHEASKPGTTSNGHMITSKPDLPGGFRLCRMCEGNKEACALTTKQLATAFRELHDLGGQGATLTKDELVTLIREHTGESDLETVYQRVVSDQ